MDLRLPRRALSALVAAGCVYETATIVTGRAPTVTALVHRYRAHRVGGPVVFGLFAALTFHLFTEGAPS